MVGSNADEDGWINRIVDRLSGGPAEPDDEPVGSTDFVAVGNTFCGHLRAIIPEVTVDDTEIVLLAFDVYNNGDSDEKWKGSWTRIIDSSGNAFRGDTSLKSDIKGGNLIDRWNAEPYISSQASRRCFAWVVLPEGRDISRIHYDFKGSWEFDIDADALRELAMSLETFREQEADRYFDWRQVDLTSPTDSANTDLGSIWSDSSGDGGSESPSEGSAIRPEASPGVSYADIGGLDNQIQQLREAVEQPLTDRGRFETLGISPPSGVLLHGPPGTGKTMLAKAVATEADATFFHIAGPELAQRYVGDGAKRVRRAFRKAEQSERAVIFIDEIDAIATARSADDSGGTEGVRRTMMQLLAEMDGFEDREGVRVLGATNRIDRLDNAILRPGRFDRLIEVAEPDVDARKAILETYTADLNTDDLDVATLAQRTDGLTGAHLQQICTEAGYIALRDDREVITQMDMLSAIQAIRSAADRIQPD